MKKLMTLCAAVAIVALAGSPAFAFKCPTMIKEGKEAAAKMNAETLVVVMLETPQAIANADAIAAIEGVDVLLIGTNDLMMEMGFPGQFGHAEGNAFVARRKAAEDNQPYWNRTAPAPADTTPGGGQ